MKVKCVWTVMLPFRFMYDNDVAVEKIKIDDISILPVRKINPSYFDSLMIEYMTNMDDKLANNNCNPFELMDFYEIVVKKVGFKVNCFIDAYYRQIENNIISQVFNGKNFITEYTMQVIDQNGKEIHSFLTNSKENGARVINKETLHTIQDCINQKERNIVEEYIRMAHCLLENGYFEMVILNLSSAIESFIKRFIYSKGITSQDLEGKGYLEKYFHSGLKKTIGCSLKEEKPEYYSLISLITEGRNRIAHGSSLFEIEEFKEKRPEELYDFFLHLLCRVRPIIVWIEDKYKTINYE